MLSLTHLPITQFNLVLHFGQGEAEISVPSR